MTAAEVVSATEPVDHSLSVGVTLDLNPAAPETSSELHLTSPNTLRRAASGRPALRQNKARHTAWDLKQDLDTATAQLLAEQHRLKDKEGNFFSCSKLDESTIGKYTGAGLQVYFVTTWSWMCFFVVLTACAIHSLSVNVGYGYQQVLRHKVSHLGRGARAFEWRLALWQGPVVLLLLCSCSLTVGATQNENALTRQSLVQAYDDMGGAGWTTSTGWRSTIPYCNWTGVSCDKAGNVSSIVLKENGLSGTIAAALGNIDSLNQLGLGSNSLSGEVGAQFSSLTLLKILGLGNNSLSGVVGAQFSSLTLLSTLFLDTNSLSGVIGAQFSSLTLLKILGLHINSLSGEVGAQFNSLTLLNTLGLGNNSLSGVIGPQFGSLTLLDSLGLYSNSLSGEIGPQFGSLTLLSILPLDSNSLSGEIGAQFSSLTRLFRLGLGSNSLSGEIGPQFGSLTALSQLLLQGNDLSGSIPHALLQLTQLELLAVHNNKIGGKLPAFTNFTQLKAFSAFGNSFQGSLRLPPCVSGLQSVVVHKNRLSCAVEHNTTCSYLHNHSSYNKGALIAPGNRFSTEAKPAWAIMSQVRFQWVATTWEQWGPKICIAAAGILSLALMVGHVLKGEWCSFFRITQRNNVYEQYSWHCIQLLVISSVLGMVIMSVYVSASGEFECGVSWHKVTLAYLNGSYTLEVAAAVLVSAATALQAFLVLLIWSWVREQHAAQTERTESNRIASAEALPMWEQEVRACLQAGELLPEQYSTHMHWQCTATNEHHNATTPNATVLIGWMWIGSVWTLVVLVFSAPTFFAMFALSVPGGQNTLGMSQMVLDVLSTISSPLLALIDTVLLPNLARKLVGTEHPRQAAMLLLISRFTILLIVPVMTTILLGTDCYGLWIKLWEPCQLSNSFEMRYDKPARPEKGIVYYAYSTQFTTHGDICDAQPLIPGRCSRFVIESLGDLLVSKLVFTAFVSPAVTLLRNLPCAVRLQEVIMTVLRCGCMSRGWALKASLDEELVLMAMKLDEVLVFGLAVPMIGPLACLAVLNQLAVLQLAKRRLGLKVNNKKYAVLLCHNFLGSLVVGAAFNLWFFFDNKSKIGGAYIACIGLPLGIVFGLAGGLLWVRSRDEGTSSDINVNQPKEVLWVKPCDGCTDLDANAI